MRSAIAQLLKVFNKGEEVQIILFGEPHTLHVVLHQLHKIGASSVYNQTLNSIVAKSGILDPSRFSAEIRKVEYRLGKLRQD